MNYEMFLYAFVALYGLCIGSFLNVLIYRIPNNLNFAKGRSMCPNCNHTLGVFDLCPVFSYAFLGGKCRYCKTKISIRYALIEILTAVLFVLVFVVNSFNLLSIIYCLIVCVLIVIGFIDYDTMDIYDASIYILLVFVLLSMFFSSDLLIQDHLIGAVIISVPMFILSKMIPGAFGFGDVELMCVLGLFLGWQNTLLLFFISLLLGSIFGVIITKKIKSGEDKHFAFGPYICIAAFVTMLYGDLIISTYLNLFM